MQFFFLTFIYPIGIFIVLAAILGYYLHKFGLPAYFTKKLENYALKQDIEEITDKIKRTEAKYDAEIADINDTLQEKAYVRKMQFEKEFEAYVKISSCLAEIQNILLDLFTFSKILTGNFKLEANATTDEKLSKLIESFSEYTNLVKQYRPFYHYDVFIDLFEIELRIHVDLLTSKSTKDILDKANALFQINDLIDSVMNSIRKRIQSHGDKPIKNLPSLSDHFKRPL